MNAVDLLGPFSFDFFRNGLVIAALTGALCGLVGVFVVLRGMSYIGHGLSHAVFGGAALAAVLGVNFFIGAGFWGLTSGLMIGRVSRRRIIGADAAIGVITTASFAMGLALQARFGQAQRSIDAVLFGNVLGVFTSDIVAVAAVGLGSVLVVVLLVTVRVVGVLLISAMLVLPAATTRLLTDSFGRMLVLSPVLGAAIGVVGMYASWYADVPSGAVIILVGTAVFLAVYISVGVRSRVRVAGLDHHPAAA